MHFEAPRRWKGVTDRWRGREDCGKTACHCSGKLFLQNDTFMHGFSEKPKTAPRCGGELFWTPPGGEKRVPKMEFMGVRMRVDCEDTQRQECARAIWRGKNKAVKCWLTTKCVSWKTASRRSGVLFFRIAPAPMKRCTWRSDAAVLRPTRCKGHWKPQWKYVRLLENRGQNGGSKTVSCRSGEPF